MISIALRRVPLTPFERLAEALTDPRRRDRVVLIALLGYLILWTTYAILAKAGQDLHFDMGELIAWSREPAFGYAKHPPFAAWLVGAWFRVFPLNDWTYYLLAVLNATVGLWIAWIVSGRYLNGEKRAAGLALLTLVPFFNFHALKFNANSVLIPLWAVTTWWFLRSFETRRIRFAALAGLGAGAALLGKYWSITLLAGLALAALADARRRVYFTSAAPWVTVAVGALVLAPHAAWLVANDFAPFHYAAGHVASAGIVSTVIATLGYVAGILGYVGVPVVLATLAARPNFAGICDTLWPSTTNRCRAALAFWAPLLLPAAVALVANLRIVSLWAMPAMTLLPVMLLSSPLLVISRLALVRMLAFAVALPVLATLAAPAVAIAILRTGGAGTGGTAHLVAAAIEQAWRASTDRPLALIGGDNESVYRVLPYLPSRPSALNIVMHGHTAGPNESRVARDGVALICPGSLPWCAEAIRAWAVGLPAARRTEVTVARHHFGVEGTPERYLIITVPPQ